MINKISNFVFLMLLFLLQSCSGGRIGNFLESSFENNISNKISQNEINKKLKSDIKVQDNKLFEKKDKTTNIKLSDEKNSQIKENSSSITTTDVNKIKTQNQIYNPKSYRIFVILKKVDPSFPTENFSKVLRSGNVNFEIEKIELITDSNKNKNK
tara:strand:- start:61 stop:525 length:465 start_codon:yes stop_codon:yes gene_type:complete